MKELLALYKVNANVEAPAPSREAEIGDGELGELDEDELDEDEFGEDESWIFYDPWEDIPQALEPEGGECQRVLMDPHVVIFALEMLGYGEHDMVPHAVVGRICQKIWWYEAVCSFFTDHLDRSAKAVNGSVQQAYEFYTAVDIVGYFVRTWNGCPELACQANFSFGRGDAEPMGMNFD